jgi:hypothetical protein
VKIIYNFKDFYNLAKHFFFGEGSKIDSPSPQAPHLRCAEPTLWIACDAAEPIPAANSDFHESALPESPAHVQTHPSHFSSRNSHTRLSALTKHLKKRLKIPKFHPVVNLNTNTSTETENLKKFIKRPQSKHLMQSSSNESEDKPSLHQVFWD